MRPTFTMGYYLGRTEALPTKTFYARKYLSSPSHSTTLKTRDFHLGMLAPSLLNDPKFSHCRDS